MMGAIRVVATSNACSSTNQIAAIQCIKEASKVIAETSAKDFVAISRDLLGILAQESVPAKVRMPCGMAWSSGRECSELPSSH